MLFWAIPMTFKRHVFKTNFCGKNFPCCSMESPTQGENCQKDTHCNLAKSRHVLGTLSDFVCVLGSDGSPSQECWHGEKQEKADLWIKQYLQCQWYCVSPISIGAESGFLLLPLISHFVGYCRNVNHDSVYAWHQGVAMAIIVSNYSLWL